MSKKIEWTIDLLAKNLSLNSLQQVIGNMGGDGTTVQFGTTGKGEKPNYQVTYQNDSRTYRGQGKEHQCHKAEAFNPENLSAPFTYADIQKALSMCQKS